MKSIFISAILISTSVLGVGLASNAATPKLVTCGSGGAARIVDQVPIGCRELPNSPPSGQVNRTSTAPIGGGETSGKILVQTGPHGAVRIVDEVPIGARQLPNSPPGSR
jgi:hypothetical protein